MYILTQDGDQIIQSRNGRFYVQEENIIIEYPVIPGSSFAKTYIIGKYVDNPTAKLVLEELFMEISRQSNRFIMPISSYKREDHYAY